jgi:hypothetical protein
MHVAINTLRQKSQNLRSFILRLPGYASIATFFMRSSIGIAVIEHVLSGNSRDPSP